MDPKLWEWGSSTSSSDVRPSFRSTCSLILISADSFSTPDCPHPPQHPQNQPGVTAHNGWPPGEVRKRVLPAWGGALSARSNDQGGNVTGRRCQHALGRRGDAVKTPRPLRPNWCCGRAKPTKGGVNNEQGAPPGGEPPRGERY